MSSTEMAGKTRNRGGQPSSPKMKVDMPKGHLGLKSSPFAPTDCKLTSQFMVVDHMNAHYRKVNKAKCAIDNTPPKAWLVSQKVRDQARRTAIQYGMKRREVWATKNNDTFFALSHADSSDVARDEMLAMMESLDDYDEVDNMIRKTRRDGDTNTTMEVHISDSGPDNPDMALIDKIVADHHNSPSKYHGMRVIASNIPPKGRTPRADSAQHGMVRPNNDRQNLNNTGRFGTMTTLHTPSTPRSADLLEQQAHKFTEERPFQPRINRTNRTSKLSQFKYYNAPKKTLDRKQGMNRTQGVDNGTRVVRSTTPLTESVDLMNASLMSRDLNQVRTPTGVPPLDISLDKDHMQWIKEQSKMAQLRATYCTDPDVSTLPKPAHPNLSTTTVTGRISTGEEELQYLEFVTEVTNDVLDRGIFTNRVLKQVFHTHIQRRKHDLKISRMRELLDDLRRDLGIQDVGDDSDLGMGLTGTYTRPTMHKTLTFAELPTNNNDSKFDMDMNDLSIHEAKMTNKELNGTLGTTFDPLLMTTKKFDMAALRQASRSVSRSRSQSRSRSPSPGTGRPPIPKRTIAGRLQNRSCENSLEEDNSGLLRQSVTSLERLDDGRVGSKQEDDLSAYKLPPPASSSVFNPNREIIPIEEQSETARTETAPTDTAPTDTARTQTACTETTRTETARTNVSYQDDYEDDCENEGTAHGSPTQPPIPTPRHRSTVVSSGNESPCSPIRSTARSSARSSAHSSARSSPQSTTRSREDTIRTEQGVINDFSDKDDDF